LPCSPLKRDRFKLSRSLFIVIPVKTGIHRRTAQRGRMGPGFHRDDDRRELQRDPIMLYFPSLKPCRTRNGDAQQNTASSRSRSLT
jgi:hypothetical protein